MTKKIRYSQSIPLSGLSIAKKEQGTAKVEQSK